MFLVVEPHAGLRPLAAIVRRARTRIDLNSYILSSRPLLADLRAAVRRGVRVRVILDQRPYGFSYAWIRREFLRVRATGARVRWAPSRFERRRGRTAFDHAKYLCTARVCELGTANFDWSAFHRNREYLVVTRRPAVVGALHEVFDADWKGHRAPPAAHRVLVLSPGTSAGDLLRVLDQPGAVDVESEEIGRDETVFRAMARRGPSLHLLLPASLSAYDRRVAGALARRGVCVRLLPKRPLYLHAKMIVGRSLGFVGSENFTRTSLDRNREVGLLLRGPVLERLRAVFRRDWSRGHALRPCR
jgi:cardiolipin synthase